MKSLKQLMMPPRLLLGLIWIVGLTATISLALLINYVPLGTWLAVIAVPLAAGMTLFFYKETLLVFTIALFVFFDLIGYWPLLDKPLRVYTADGILLLLAILSIKLLTRKVSLKELFASPISRLLGLNFLYGGIALVMGFAAGHALNDVLGDFRRFYVYPLAFFVVLSNVFSLKDVRRLTTGLGLAVLVISGIALSRVITGNTWDPAQFRPAGDFRAIGYFTGVIALMGMGTFYGLGFSVRKNRLFFFLTVGILLIVALVSGYRLLWILAGIALISMSIFALGKKGNTVQLVFVVLSGLGLLGGFVVVVQRLFPDLWLLWSEKFLVGVLGFSFESNARYFAWQTAWEKFLSSPIIGIGIGDQFEFLLRNSRGYFQTSNMTTHNILLDLLYQTGAIGGGLFLLIHFVILKTVWGRLQGHKLERRLPLLGMLFGYLSCLVMSMFQPTLDAPGAIVALYLWCGFMLKLTETGSAEASLIFERY